MVRPSETQLFAHSHPPPSQRSFEPVPNSFAWFFDVASPSGKVNIMPHLLDCLRSPDFFSLAQVRRWIAVVTNSFRRPEHSEVSRLATHHPTYPTHFLDLSESRSRCCNRLLTQAPQHRNLMPMPTTGLAVPQQRLLFPCSAPRILQREDQAKL